MALSRSLVILRGYCSVLNLAFRCLTLPVCHVLGICILASALAMSGQDVCMPAIDLLSYLVATLVEHGVLADVSFEALRCGLVGRAYIGWRF